MKRSILRLFVMIGFGLAAAASAHGQIGQAYRANIPFDFVVNNTQMKAGPYRVAPIQSNQCHRMIAIQDIDRNARKMLGVAGCGAGMPVNDQAGALKFWHNADKYILVSIDVPTFALSMKGAWTDVQILTGLGKVPEFVTVALQ